MARVLICTVGGSPAPVVHAVRQNGREGGLAHVYFLCSSSEDGAGTDRTIGAPVSVRRQEACADCEWQVVRQVKEPPVAQQAGLEADRYSIEAVADPDSLRQVMEACERIDEDLRGRWPAATVIANYTGATKTMALGLGLHALGQGWELQLNTTGEGYRDNLRKIELGDVALLQEAGWLRVREGLERAAALEEREHFAAAAAMLEGLSAGARLEGRERREVLEALDRCRMRAAWDRFDHAEALRWARRRPELARCFAARLSRLEKVVGVLQDGGAPVKVEALRELMEDLLENARRCARKGRFDDAVGRLYRLTELVAQGRLRSAYGLRTEDLDLTHPAIPAAAREGLEGTRGEETGRVRISLVSAYRLLAGMEDALGRYFEKSRGLMQWLEVRNGSLFAHGLRPIGEDQWLAMGPPWEAWIQGAVEILEREGPVPGPGRGGS